MKRRKKKQTQDNQDWMTTYADLVTLLLCFFVLLFSMSQVDAVRFEAVAESFRNRTILFDDSNSVIDFEYRLESAKNHRFEELSDMQKSESFFLDGTTSNQLSLVELLMEINIFLREHELEDVITATRTDQGVVLVLQERILFDTADSSIKSEGKPFLDKIALLLKNIPNTVRVEGHTDDRRISTTQFPSNWELSGARSSGVIRYILDSADFVSSRFISVGHGDTRPIAPNDSPENWQKNRRVEIVILELTEGTN